ncbi:tetratricopeptide repeat protein [Leptolyngbya boryana CZ1]|uniref:Tetratricopeptide repeat protein n=1 Tax=Leptolyngbya boryana CZ1 TaxID=3060204 RepID=A0AA97AUB7_LEPBY|nr:tetratricopeptide repeat protein [Leptolyngbya boryana]WNZ44111.1 tetratricopeptide repeat protein [Leptolyngbya boryana CZ1]
MISKSNWLKGKMLAFVLISMCSSGVPLSVSWSVNSAIAQTVQDRKAEGDRLLEQGRQLSQMSRYTDALQTYQRVLLVYQEIKDQVGEANTLGNIGLAYSRLSQYEQAITSYEKALSIFQRENDYRSRAFTLINLGDAYRFKNPPGYSQAVKHYEEALRIHYEIEDLARKSTSRFSLYFQTLTPNQEADALYQIGKAYVRLAEYNKSIRYYERALSITEKLNNYRDPAILIGLGNAYRSKSEYSQALKYYSEALKIALQEKDRVVEVDALIGIGNTYTGLSEYGKAINSYEQALLVARQGKDSRGEATALASLAGTYGNLRQHNKAINYSHQALRILQQINDRGGEANALMNIGSSYAMQANHAMALKYLQQALLIFQEIKDRNGEASSLINIGKVYYDSSKPEVTIAYSQKALSLFQEVEDRSGEAHSLTGIGASYSLLRQHKESMDYYSRALTIYQQRKIQAGEGNVLRNIGSSLTTQGKPELAIAFYKQSVNVYESIRADLKNLPREQQQSYAESVADTYRELADLLIQRRRFPEAQAVLELLKLRELRDFTRDVGIGSPGINLAQVEETALKQILKEYTTIAQFNEQISKCDRERCSTLKDLQRQRDQMNESVNAELRKQAAVLAKHFSTESATLTPEKLNAEARRIVNAQPGTVLIYPLVLKDKLQFLLALKAEDGAFTFRPVEVPNVSADQLFKQIQTFRTQLQDPTSLKDLQATSQQLHNWLIKPLEPELKSAKHLVFAPDSTIRYIPLAALYDGKQYLIERFSISTITAASKTDTTETFSSLSIDSSFLLAVGASTFQGLPALPNVPIELNAIVKDSSAHDTHGIYPGSEVLNTQFSFESLKDKLKGHRILHIATHGKFVAGRPENSYLVPGSGENLTIERIDQLINYGISNVHLVVLSACETAVGDRASDGIEIPGISYFFLKNEVKSVIASLWSVNDASTALLMQRFYQNLASKKTTKAEALQQIQREFIRGNLATKDAPVRNIGVLPDSGRDRATAQNYSHPYHWAPFILIGNSL